MAKDFRTQFRRRGWRPFSPSQLDARRAVLPAISYPAQLPVSARREDIKAAISASQVVIVAGETGSGKTTQLPKICLELGRGIAGMIGHTQPRRVLRGRLRRVFVMNWVWSLVARLASRFGLQSKFRRLRWLS